MAVIKLNELLEKLRSQFTDNTSDEVLSIIEDITDTYNDFETKTKDETKWEEKYKENDAMWRKKYKDRFFSSPKDGDDDDIDEGDDGNSTPPKKSYDELFKEEK